MRSIFFQVDFNPFLLFFPNLFSFFFSGKILVLSRHVKGINSHWRLCEN